MEHTRSDHQSRPFSKPKLSGPLQRAYDPSEEAIRSYFGSIFAGFVKLRPASEFLQILGEMPRLLSRGLFYALTTTSTSALSQRDFEQLFVDFGKARIQNLAALLFNIASGRQSLLQRGDLLRFLNLCKHVLPSQPSEIKSHLSQEERVQLTTKFYLGKQHYVSFQRFCEVAFCQHQDLLSQILRYMSKVLDVEGRLFRRDREVIFKLYLEPHSSKPGLECMTLPKSTLLECTLASRVQREASVKGIFSQLITSRQTMRSSRHSSSNDGTPAQRRSLFQSKFKLSEEKDEQASSFYHIGNLMHLSGDNIITKCVYELRGRELFCLKIDDTQVRGRMVIPLTRNTIIENCVWNKLYGFQLSLSERSMLFLVETELQRDQWVQILHLAFPKGGHFDKLYDADLDLPSPFAINRSTGEKCQITCIDKQSGPQNSEDWNASNLQEQRLRLQVSVMARVVPFMLVKQYFELSTCFILIKQYHPSSTTLDKLLSLSNNQLPQAEVRGYISEILDALLHLQELGVLACQLIPENIILLPLACSQSRSHPMLLRGVRLPRQMENRLLPSSNSIFAKVRQLVCPFAEQMFQLGILTYRLLSGVQLYESNGFISLRTPNYSKDLKGISRYAVNFCKALLALKSAKRPTIRTARGHKWINN